MRHLLFATALVLCPLSAAEAQDVTITADAGTIIFSAHGQALHLPAPNWLPDEQRNGADVLNAVSSNYQPEATRVRLTMSPQGEQVGNWSTLYTAELIDGALSGLGVQRETLINRLSSTCPADQRRFFLLGEGTDGTLPPLGFACGHYIEGGALPQGQGEISISVFKRGESGAALLMQQWRGPAFDLGQTESWPVAAETVEAQAAAFQAATLQPAD
jgi:hypothetical protein